MPKARKTRWPESSFRVNYPCVDDNGFTALERAPGIREFRLDNAARAAIERAVLAARHNSNDEFKPILETEVRKHLRSLKKDPARKSEKLAEAWSRPIGNDAFSMAKMRVRAAAKKHGIELCGMTAETKSRLSHAIDELLKVRLERNPPHAPRQHWGIYSLVVALAIEYERASGQKLTKYGFNRRARSNEPYGPFFDFVKVALRYVPEAHPVPLNDNQIANTIKAALHHGGELIANPPPVVSVDERRIQLTAALDWLYTSGKE